MISLHPKILEKDGKKDFAVISYEEFLEVREVLEDYEALKALRNAKSKEADAGTISFDEAKRKLNVG